MQVLLPTTLADGGLTIGNLPAVGLGRYKQDDFFLRLQKAVGYGGAVSTTGYVGSVLLVSAGVLSAPLTLPVLLPAFLLAGWHGWRSATQGQLKVAQQDLSRRLGSLIRDIQQKLFGVDQASGHFGPVDQYFGARELALSEQVSKLVSQKLAEAQAEINRLTESANLDDQQRKAKGEEVRGQLVEWDGIGQTIKAIQGALKELDRSVGQA